MRDLVALTAELVDIPSVSHHEGPLADHLEGVLAGVGWLAVDRHGDNVVARTDLGRRHRLILAAHIDTVPPDGNQAARVEGDTVWGLGASDMKAGLAVFLELARTVADPAVDVTYVFYACEEVEAAHNGLGHLFRDRPDLVGGDAAILGEPTRGAVEAGCQGTMRLRVTLAGARAHTSRPWLGVNAVHRLGPLLGLLDGYRGRRPVLAGCEYSEALQAVGVEGGVAGNVVPDRASLLVNHRFAPDRTPEQAEARLRDVLAPALGDGDTAELVDVAPGAAPGLDHALLRPLVERHRLEVRAKLGWTDVARFAAAGVPACNLGPGDPDLAHTAGERAERGPMEATLAVLSDLLRRGTGPSW
ncbi:MAG: succinyl-diaminopimelate desuccinylase [Acidimicrobiales bacterium]